MEFHHIGIFVKSISEGSNIFFSEIKVVKKSEIIEDKNLKVRVQFFEDNKGIKYELVEGLGDNNPVKNSLKNNKNILNHIAYKAENFNYTLDNLLKKNFIQISKIENSVAFKGKKIIFLLSPLNYIIELIEK